MTGIKDDVYDRVFRKLNPPSHPFLPYGKRPRLQDLWPDEQEKFKRNVDAIVEVQND